jgi:hypothetical protein
MQTTPSTNATLRTPASRRFVIALLLALLAALCLIEPHPGGDILEYPLDTIALAHHGTPAIRLDDITHVKALLPQLAPYFADTIEQDIRTGAKEVFPAFARGRDGNVYSIHFFGYPALAALPFRLFETLGIPPLKAFQVVNYAAVFVLGLALLRFFRSATQAALGLLLYLLCGGMLYLNWTSPESMSASFLLAGLLFYLSAAPVAGCILAGLAAQQNPTILMFFVFAPLLKLCLDWRAGALGPNLRAQLTRANLAGLALGAALFALPPLFNLAEYGVPNIIARKFSDVHLISGTRLVSFFFDLNQGMVLAVPGVLAALLCRGRRPALRAALVPALCLAFILAMIVPALAVLNWNSGAAGVMRYGFWAAMPLLLVLLLRVRAAARWPAPLALWLALAQGAAMLHASSYSYVEFSPLARLVLAHAPQHYHPEPEIFAERMAHNDDYIEKDKVYAYRPPGLPQKTLYNNGSAHAGEQLCGPGRHLAPGNRIVSSSQDWKYIDGPVLCQDGTRLGAR